MKLIQYFTFHEIVKTLSRLRVKVASSRHRYQLYWSQLSLTESPVEKKHSELDEMLPPRRQWRRAKKEERKRQAVDEVLVNSIVRMVIGVHNRSGLKETKWGVRLLAFYERVMSRISNENEPIHLSPPKLQLIRKGKGRVSTMPEEMQKGSYRCISIFTNLEDRLILSKTATYLRDIFDQAFLDCCYAFRKNGRRFSFQTAVEALIAYRRRFLGQTLYVADCDVQKFFDVINHDVIRNAYNSFVQRLGNNSPDEIASKVLDAYLNVYSFPKNLDECQDVEVAKKRMFVERVPDEALHVLYPNGDLSDLSLGIPQGGALSPLVANIVMDAVDRAVRSVEDDDLFYARFCDDIIIIHPNKQKCQEALNRYLNAMKLLKLPIHKLSKVQRYSREYFTEKSKGPIAWGKTQIGRPGTKWVSFLGHQVCYDGTVRVRKETIEKHQNKLRMEKECLQRSLRKAQGYRKGKDWRSLFATFTFRLVSSGVGHVDSYVNTTYLRNWISIFRRNLEAKGAVISQMKRLDRTRSGVIASAKKLLKVAKFKQAQEEGEPATQDQPSNKGYLGAPFSYYGTLRALNRPSLGKDDERVGIREYEEL